MQFLELRDRPIGQIRTFPVDQARAQAILQRAAQEGREHLRPSESMAVLQAYGLPRARWERLCAASPVEAALAAAPHIGHPLAMKLDALAAIHKTERAGVILDVRDASGCEEAYKQLAMQLADTGKMPGDGILIQEMRTGGTEVILGLTREAFAPLLMFGLRGVFVGVLRDVASRTLPVTDADDAMVREIRGDPLLAGARGRPPLALAAAEEALLRLAQLAVDFPVIHELDVDLFLLSERAEDCAMLDARVRFDPRALK